MSDIALSPFAHKDLPDYVALMNEPRIAKWLPHVQPFSEAQGQQYWDRMQDADNPVHPRSYSVWVDGAWQGIVHCSQMQRNVHGTQFGYYLRPEIHGKGVGTQAVIQFTERLISEGMIRLQALVDPENVASRRVMEKSGYLFEGILRSFLTFRGGLIDVCMYARINSAAPEQAL